MRYLQMLMTQPPVHISKHVVCIWLGTCDYTIPADQRLLYFNPWGGLVTFGNNIYYLPAERGCYLSF